MDRRSGLAAARRLPPALRGLATLAGPPFTLLDTEGFRVAPLAHGAVVQPAALTPGSMVLGPWVLQDRLTPMLLQGDRQRSVGRCLLRRGGDDAGVFSMLQTRWTISPLDVAVLSLATFAPAYLALDGAAALLALPAGALEEQIIIHGERPGIVAVFAFSRAVELLGQPCAAALPALVPAGAILAGIPVAGDLPLPVQLAGLRIVVFGLPVSRLRSTRRPNPRPAATPCRRPSLATPPDTIRQGQPS